MAMGLYHGILMELSSPGGTKRDDFKRYLPNTTILTLSSALSNKPMPLARLQVPPKGILNFP
jgi:hypothetical protein